MSPVYTKLGMSPGPSADPPPRRAVPRTGSERGVARRQARTWLLLRTSTGRRSHGTRAGRRRCASLGGSLGTDPPVTPACGAYLEFTARSPRRVGAPPGRKTADRRRSDRRNRAAPRRRSRCRHVLGVRSPACGARYRSPGWRDRPSRNVGERYLTPYRLSGWSRSVPQWRDGREGRRHRRRRSWGAGGRLHRGPPGTGTGPWPGPAGARLQ